ncbi:MAG: sigma 54-interacting transcriptional regulator [Acidobacteria bacterium]|nr:sigma 54-interacting transcriptional regulator [Acidobacteriota bacterium]
MPYRLVVVTERGPQRVVLHEGPNLVGSDPECEVHLPHPSVSHRHASLDVGPDGVMLRDLGSSNGTMAGPRRIRECELVPGVALFFGRVPAVLEQVAQHDLDIAIPFGLPAEASAGAPETGPAGTVTLEPVVNFVLDDLPRLLRRLVDGTDTAGFPQDVGQALFLTIPCLSLDVLSRARGEDAIRFTARADGQDGETAVVTRESTSGATIVRAAFASLRLADTYGPLLHTAASLVALSDGAGRNRSSREARPRQPTPSPPDPPTLDAEMRTLYADAAKVARGDVSVLITGESGTGKELLARYLHAASSRTDGPFVALNCAALPRDLLEVELFGIERGVATGVDSRPGKFELADAGTLFLDEIGDMAPETQASILRVLQERLVYRLGGRDPHPARIRVVAATNRDLTPMLEDGRFRSDLYHRIATWVVELPPLRQRRVDIPGLAAFFLAREAARHGRRVGGLSRGAVEALTAFDWPGNIRQLEHEMSRAVLFLDDGDTLDSARLHPAILAGTAAKGARSLDNARHTAERDEIVAALHAHRGDVAEAASKLGISRATAYRRLKTLGIDPARWQ